MTRRQRAWEIFVALLVLVLIVIAGVELLAGHYAHAEFDIALAVLLIVLQRVQR